MTKREETKLVRRLNKAARTNLTLAARCKAHGRTHAESYASGSAFGFFHAARIVKGEAK